MLTMPAFCCSSLSNWIGSSSSSPLLLWMAVVAGPHELVHTHAGNLDGVLEAEEDARAGTLFRRHAQQVDAVQQRLAGLHDVLRMAREDVGEGALAGAVGPHDGVHLALLHRKVDALQDCVASDGGGQVANFQHVTLPVFSIGFESFRLVPLFVKTSAR